MANPQLYNFRTLNLKTTDISPTVPIMPDAEIEPSDELRDYLAAIMKDDDPDRIMTMLTSEDWDVKQTTIGHVNAAIIERDVIQRIASAANATKVLAITLSQNSAAEDDLADRYKNDRYYALAFENSAKATVPIPNLSVGDIVPTDILGLRVAWSGSKWSHDTKIRSTMGATAGVNPSELADGVYETFSIGKESPGARATSYEREAHEQEFSKRSRLARELVRTTQREVGLIQIGAGRATHVFSKTSADKSFMKDKAEKITGRRGPIRLMRLETVTFV